MIYNQDARDWLIESKHWFAWYPVKLLGGKWTWLTWRIRKRKTGTYPDFIPGRWEYL